MSLTVHLKLDATDGVTSLDATFPVSLLDVVDRLILLKGLPPGGYTFTVTGGGQVLASGRIPKSNGIRVHSDGSSNSDSRTRLPEGK